MKNGMDASSTSLHNQLKIIHSNSRVFKEYWRDENGG